MNTTHVPIAKFKVKAIIYFINRKRKLANFEIFDLVTLVRLQIFGKA